MKTNKLKYLLEKEDCHKGSKLVFTDPVSKIPVYAGGISRDLFYIDNAIVLSCGVEPFEEIVLKGISINDVPEIAQFVQIPEIRLTWPDYGVPTMPRDFWINLITMFRRKKQPVLVCCMGGHGRTGTALSILASLMDVITDKECPVTFIRQAYCSHAVETTSQIDYIRKVTGRNIVDTNDTNMFDLDFYQKGGFANKKIERLNTKYEFYFNDDFNERF